MMSSGGGYVASDDARSHGCGGSADLLTAASDRLTRGGATP